MATGFPCSFVSICSSVRFEVGPDPVHLVDEADPGHAVLVGLAPHRLRLRLHAGDRVEHRHGAVEHTERPLHLGREIHVARRVDDVDPVLAPEAGRRGGGNGDPPLLLLRHPVHDRGAVVNLTDLVRDPRVEEDPLGGGRLAGINVRHDADIPRLVECDLPWHYVNFSSLAAGPHPAANRPRCAPPDPRILALRRRPGSP